MSAAIARADVEAFRAVVERDLGLQFDDAKLDFLEEVLRERMGRTGSEQLSSYFERMAGTGRQEEIRALAEKLTVGETYFFRNPDNFRAFIEVVVPERMRAQQTRRRLRILSAGCASGEEAYTIAILLRERVPELAAWDVRIEGIDLNPAVVAKARNARYSAWSLRGTPEDLRAKYFRDQGAQLVLDETVKPWVSFGERNLVDADPSFWRPEVFDVIFCRNVTMYFPPDVTRTVIARMARSLAPRGFLFLGHAETLRGLSQDFHLRHTHDTFYYQRRAQGDRPSELESDRLDGPEHRERPERPERPAPSDASQGSAITPPSTSWFEAIRQASLNIANLAERSTPAPEAPRSPAPTWDRAAVLELLRGERFAEAVALMRALPPESLADPDAQLLLAVLLTNTGALDEAETRCRQLLESDDLNAGAHYVMALCREHASDREAAIEHDQAAIHLDATFAIARLHLGLLLKRGGDAEMARRELAAALALVGRDDETRIRLFGGGFTREALEDLCRAELRALGGNA
jgi:chemotaxis protein methyltransferase CheR